MARSRRPLRRAIPQNPRIVEMGLACPCRSASFSARMEHRFRYRPGEIVPGTGLKVIRPLGSGGMGAVYEVEETSVEAPFVMKVVPPELLRPEGTHPSACGKKQNPKRDSTTRISCAFTAPARRPRSSRN